MPKTKKSRGALVSSGKFPKRFLPGSEKTSSAYIRVEKKRLAKARKTALGAKKKKRNKSRRTEIFA